MGRRSRPIKVWPVHLYLKGELMIGITMPQPSHYVTDGKVTHWYKKEGEQVREGEPLLEIEV
jgi:hypothetical protein